MAKNKNRDQHLVVEVASRDARDSFRFANYLPNPDPVLRKLGKSIQVYRDLLTDPLVKGNARRRRVAVRGLNWNIAQDNASDPVQGAVLAMFDQIDVYKMIGDFMNAPLFGYQPVEVVWQPGTIWTPARITAKPPEWFVFGNSNELRFRSSKEPTDGEPVDEFKFIVATQDASYDNPYGEADLALCFWPAAFKKGGLKFWVTFTEKYGMPYLLGKLPRNAPPDQTTKLLNDLVAMVQDAVAVVPTDSSVEFLKRENSNSNADLYEKLLMYCRSEINIALLGQNQTTEAEANRASSQAGQMVTREIRDDDKQIVASAVQQLIHYFCQMNFGDVPEPAFELFEEETGDANTAQRDKNMTESGVIFTPAYWKRMYRLQDGDIDDKTMLAMVQNRVQKSETPGVAFAEGQPYPDQLAIDQAAAQVTGLQQQAETLVQPVLDGLANGAPETDLLAQLAQIYPNMDDTALVDELTRLAFLSETVGRLSVFANA